MWHCADCRADYPLPVVSHAVYHGSAWTDAEHPECAFYGHSPNAAGTECEMCGLPAEPGDPDELAEALTGAYETRIAQVAGQVGWLD